MLLFIWLVSSWNVFNRSTRDSQMKELFKFSHSSTITNISRMFRSEMKGDNRTIFADGIMEVLKVLIVQREKTLKTRRVDWIRRSWAWRRLLMKKFRNLILIWCDGLSSLDLPSDYWWRWLSQNLTLIQGKSSSFNGWLFISRLGNLRRKIIVLESLIVDHF